MKRIKAGDINFAQALISETQLMAMDVGQCLVFISGRYKYIEQFPDYTEMFDCTGLYEFTVTKVKKNEVYKSISLVKLKNSILTSKKPKTTNSFYRSMFFAEEDRDE